MLFTGEDILRILLYIAIILIGALLGAYGKLSDKFTGKLTKLQFASLLLMLFVMGINIGVNDEVVNGFYKLGFQAFILAAFSVAFSILFVKLVSNFVQQDRKDNE
jgi:uncharacterized membrane protein YbjE (DUF340 family)